MAIQPSPKQKEAFNTPLAEFNIFQGVTGSGKSHVANMISLKYLWSKAPDGGLALFTGNTSESLYDNVIKPLINIDPIGCFKYMSKAGNQRLIFNNSRKEVEIACVGANNERAQDRIQGKNVCYWYADEIPKQPKSFVEMALSRCRMIQGGKLIISPSLWTLNPEFPTHYIKTDYIDDPNKKVNNWFFSFKDNPLCTPEYIEAQKNRYSGVFYQRMIEGKWVASEGMVYDKFNRSEHVLKDYPKNQVNEYVIGIDWGYEHPLAIALFAIDYDGRYYLIDEIYLTKQLIDQTLVDLMKRRGWFNIQHEQKQFKPTYAYADSARPDYIRLFYQLTSIPTFGASKEVVEGIQSVQRQFVKRGDGSYGLYILEKCTNAIREIEGYQWASGRGDVTKDEPKKEEDHIVDSVRYVVHTRERNKVRMIKKNPFR